MIYIVISYQKSENFLTVSVTAQRDSHKLADSLKSVRAVSERVINITVISLLMNDTSKLVSENSKIFKN